jgi:hypothetical protein
METRWGSNPSDNRGVDGVDQLFWNKTAVCRRRDRKYLSRSRAMTLLVASDAQMQDMSIQMPNM